MFEIRKAYNGNVRHVGWDLFINGEWAQRFATKREATVAAAELAVDHPSFNPVNQRIDI